MCASDSVYSFLQTTLTLTMCESH